LESKTDFVNMMLEVTEAKISDAGGREKWDALSDEEKACFDSKAYNQVRKALGDIAFDALSEEEKKEVKFLVWTGCCMHKEMNAVKGRNSTMQAYWSIVVATPPKLLTNKDNAAAERLGGAAARQRAKMSCRVVVSRQQVWWGLYLTTRIIKRVSKTPFGGSSNANWAT
jgi:hypothetical protein